MVNFSKLVKPPVLLLAQLLCCATPAAAFWRLLCKGQIGVARIDPIADTGMISDHAHAIHGAQNFTFDSTGASLMESSCSSCAVTEDRSAYWTPPLYFLDDNGTYSLVPQVGGMTVYYFNNNSPENDNTNVTAFPPNFRMISGDTRQRNFTVPTLTPFIMGEPFNLTQQSDWGPGSNEGSQLALSQLALGFNCLNYAVPPEGSREYNYLRPKSYLDANCTDGIRLEVMFPSCWDGVNLDTPDHKSHVQFPDLVQEGYCNQTTHPHRIPAIFFETIFDTYSFRDLDGSFVIANGDPTGFGYHGDFMSGWNQSFLQQAINVCTDSSGEEQDCPIFTIRDDFGENCTGTLPAPLQSEDVHGPMTTLPGDKIIQSGPGYADAPQGTPLSIGLTGSLPPSSANLDTAVSTSTCPNTSSTPLPSITQAPTVSTAPANIFSTSTYTTNNLVVEVVIVESYATVTETATDLVKRHHGSHHLYHRHH